MMKETHKFTLDNFGGGNPHDYFGRKTIGDPLIASDLLRNYADPVIAENVDLENLQSEPTQFFGPTHPIAGLKEVILDVPYIAHLHDPEWKSEVLIVVEHKSSPNQFVVLQLCVQALLSIYKRWTDAGRPAGLGKFKPPIPLMVLLYCGTGDLPDESFFQDIFEHLPESLKPFVPQFRLLSIDLRKFDYGHLPGRPDTQSVVETMKRAFDGTLSEHFLEVVGRLGTIPIDDRIMDLIGSIAWFSGRVTNITPEQIVEAVTNVIKGKEGIEMSEIIQKGVFQQGVEVGEARGKAKAILQTKFKSVSEQVIDVINQMTDPVALDSLAAHIANCTSMDQVEEALK